MYIYVYIHLRGYGLDLNMRKTKLMSTTVTDNDTTLIETDNGFIELVPAECMHKYLGRGWSGSHRPPNFVRMGKISIFARQPAQPPCGHQVAPCSVRCSHQRLHDIWHGDLPAHGAAAGTD